MTAVSRLVRLGQGKGEHITFTGRGIEYDQGLQKTRLRLLRALDTTSKKVNRHRGQGP